MAFGVRSDLDLMFFFFLLSFFRAKWHLYMWIKEHSSYSCGHIALYASYIRTQPPSMQYARPDICNTNLSAHPQAVIFPKTCPFHAMHVTVQKKKHAPRLLEDVLLTYISHGWVFTILNYTWWSTHLKWHGHSRQSVEAGSGDTNSLAWTQITSFPSPALHVPSCSCLPMFIFIFF